MNGKIRGGIETVTVDSKLNCKSQFKTLEGARFSQANFRKWVIQEREIFFRASHFHSLKLSSSKQISRLKYSNSDNKL